MRLKRSNKTKAAFSLIEVLIVMFIAAVAFTSFYTVSTLGTKYIIESKNRLGALAFANEKMEIVRNLSYEDVGTIGSAEVAGNLPKEVDQTANGRSYHVSTSVRFFDDPMDGTSTTSPADPIPNDYKIVEIVVSWIDSNGQTQSVSSTSRFVPPGLETNIGGSPLAINVVDPDTLLPISGALVHISNPAASIDDTNLTNIEGHLMLPAAKISSDSHVTISKNGYETIGTLDSSDTFTPVYGHVSVVASFLNTYNYLISRLSNLVVKSVDYQDNPVGGVGFSIGGGKIIGHNELGVSIYNMANTTGTTNSSTGEIQYSNISPGNYNIQMTPNAQYEFIDYDPSITPAFLPAGSDMTYKLRVANKEVNALFAEVRNSDLEPAPVAGAKVTLTDGVVDVFTEKLSSLRGVVFYPDGSTPLENKEYTLKVEADGYESKSQLITIDKLTHVVVDLVRI